jgi:uncharacterized protein
VEEYTMKRKSSLAIALLGTILVLAAALSGCASNAKASAPCEFKTLSVSIPSRGVQVPAILTVPTVEGKAPLVVMAHGHGGSKDEAGGFTAIAEELARKGIASIRMDFPGCGQSKEPFTENNVTNMVADVEASRQFAIAASSIDTKRVGMFGYSMGGRIAILSARRATYRSLALLAPVATDGLGSMYTFMGGQSSLKALAEKAKADGHVVFKTIFGQTQDLGLKWFTDNESAKCIETIGAYTGPILFVHGSVDTIIDQSVIDESAAAAKKSSGVERVTIEGADHGYGFYGGEARLKTETVNAIASFFAKTLR